MVLKELIINSFYVVGGCGGLKELIVNSFYLGGCGGLERTDVLQFLLLAGEMVLKETNF